jgi:RHS repeat-associated protein
VRIDDAAGSTVFDYNQRGQAVKKKSMPAGSATAYQIDLEYRPDGNLASVTYPQTAAGRLRVTYQYDSCGRVSAVPGIVSGIEYDAGGRRLAVRYANGVVSSRAYDPATLDVTQLSHANSSGAIRSTSLSWDRVGNLSRIDSPDPAIASMFSYDDLHRLVHASTGSGTVLTVAYDDAGNITQKSDVGRYAYGERGAPATCLTSAGAAAITYTALGQIETAPWGTHAYDTLGRLVSIAGATNAAFTYDHGGSRSMARFGTGADVRTRITPDALFAIEDGTVVRYLFDGTRLVARDDDAIGRTYLHEDHLGSIVAITGNDGALLEEIAYDPFGAVVSRRASGSVTPVGFAGGALDGATGLSYLQARYYHPQLGRFISVDPIVQDAFAPIAWNAYAYCRDNPQTYIDPTGRNAWKLGIGALAVLMIVALVVVSILTLGTVGLIIVGIGLAAGGVVGGIAAARAGGDKSDIFLGVLVGAAVGGWAAFASIYAGAAAASGLGMHGIGGAIAAGAINGAINGAAMGFAAGFAGGKTTSYEQLIEKTALGALVGAVVGGALGGISYHFAGAPQSTEPLARQTYAAGTVPQTPPPEPPGPVAPATPINDPTRGGFTTFGSKYATQLAGPAGSSFAHYVFSAPFVNGLAVFATDAAAGAADLGALTWAWNKLFPKWAIG